MDPKKISYEHVLFLTAFVLALVLRFYQLGASPLTDKEAYYANQAVLVSKGETNIEIGPNPGYVLLTGAIFSLFGASEFTARLWPVLAGSLVLWVAWLLRPGWGKTFSARITLLILAFGLALDPGLVTISRQAGGPSMAIGFSVLALAFIARQNFITSGIFAGLGILSGPSAYTGLTSLLISFVLIWFWNKRSAKHSTSESTASPSLSKAAILQFIAASSITILIVGTFFFLYPQGFSAWISSIQVYLEGWVQQSGNPAGLIVLALVVFGLLPVVFFLSASARRLVQYLQDQSSIHPWLLFAYTWFGLALLLAVIYPSREVAGLGWTILPLWWIAAGELVNYLPSKQTSPLSVILAFFTFILMSLFWFTLSAVSKMPGANTGLDLRLLVPVGVLVLIGLSAALVSLGWSSDVGQKGLAWGLCAALVVYSFSVLTGAAYQRPNNPVELWGALPGSGQNRLVEHTLEGISRQLTGIKNAADIAAIPDSASLRWTLRNYPQTRFIKELPAGDLPSIVLTSAEQELPTLTAAYTGQDFPWWTWRGWPGSIPPNPIRWLNYREAPVQSQNIILWVRSDLLPGTHPSENESPEKP